MPLLSFDVYSNYEEVTRLQREITALQNKLKSFGPGTAKSTIQSIESQLQSATARLRALSSEAANAGAALELNIRKGANGAIDAVNELQGKLSDPIRGLTQIAGVAGLGAFLNQMKNIRAEFQQMETSINVLVGETKGKTLMSQLTDFAKVSPLDFKGTVGGAQMMLGFGIDADKVPRYLSAIGDVAMGDAQRFQSLTLAFSQMSATGKLMGQDLNQMINAGFNPLTTMAEKSGKSVATLKKEMSDGKITAQMVQQAFVDATDAGGKFYQMSEKASKTIGGQMSMLEDASDLMFNDLGSGAEDMIIKVIEGATYLVEHWKEVGRVLIGMLATYGIYKTSAMAYDFAEKKSAEEKTQAIVDGYTKQLEAMEKYEAAKRAEQGLDDVDALVRPQAIDKLEKGEKLSDEDLAEIDAYTKKLALMQAEKEASDATAKVEAENRQMVTAAMDAELAKLRELNGEKKKEDTASSKPKKYDDDLQQALDSGFSDEEQVSALQEQRDLLQERAKASSENLAIAKEEYDKAVANKDAIEEQVKSAEARKDAADALVEKLQEEYDLLHEDDEQNGQIDEYGQVEESLQSLMKAEELEEAQKEASARASELAAEQTRLETAEQEVNTAQTLLNSEQTEANSVAEAQNSAALASNSTAESTNTAATKANTASTSTNTAATNTNSVAQNTNTVSTRKNTLATKLAAGWSKVKATAHHLETAAINTVTRATEALKAAWATNPLGIILTIGTAVISTLYSIFGAMEDLEEETNKFGNEAKQTADEVDLLFAVLETTNEQSKVYQESLEKLTRTMRDYGLVQKEEEVSLERLKGLREQLIELIIEEGRQRQIANNIANLQDSIKKDTENVEAMIQTFVIESWSGGERTDEWKDVASKLISEDLERNAEEVGKLKETIESYTNAKRDMFTEWSEQDQQTLDAAIQKYDKIVFGRANTVAKKYEGKDFALTVRTSDSKGYTDTQSLKWLGEYTDAVEQRNEKMKDYIALQKESEAITEAGKAAPEAYSTEGKGYDDLKKDLEEAKDAAKAAKDELDGLNDKKATVKVDKKEADNATKSVKKTKDAVNDVSNAKGKVKVDVKEAETAKKSANDTKKAVEDVSSTPGKVNVNSEDAKTAGFNLDNTLNGLNLLNGTNGKVNINWADADNALFKINNAHSALGAFTAFPGKTNIDSSEAVDAKDNTDAATDAVNEHTATEGVTNVDSTQAVDAKSDIAAATDEMVILDSTEADPVVKTTWIDNFIKKIGEAWDALMKLLGIEDESKIAAPTPTPAKEQKVDKAAELEKKRQEAEDKRKKAREAILEKARNAKTRKELSEAKKAINGLREDLVPGSKEDKGLQKILDGIEKKEKKGQKDKSDDPKQRAYDKRKMELEEQKKTAEQMLAEENRLEELRIARMEDNSEKEIAKARFEAKKKREALVKERQDEADRLEKLDLQLWLKGGKNRKEYQYYDKFAGQLKAKREEWLKQAGQNIGFDTQSALITDSETENLQKVYREDMSAMRDYLKEYGTFQQKKLAIAEEYAEKIRNAQNAGERLKLEAQRDRDVRDVEAKAITSRIDWYSVFDNLGVVMRGQLEPLYKQLQAYVKTDAFRKSGAENQRTVIQAMENMRSQLGTTETSHDLAQALTDYQTAIGEMRLAMEQDRIVSEKNAQLMADVAKAQSDVEAAKQSGDDTALQAANDALVAATANLEAYSATVAENNNAMTEAQNNVQSSGSMLSNTAKNVMKPVSKIATFLAGAGFSQFAELWGAFDQLKGGIDGLNALSEASEASQKLADAAEDTSEAVNETATALPGMLNTLMEQFPEVMDGLSDAVKNVTEGVKDGADAVGDGMADTGEAVTEVISDALGEGLSETGIIGQIIAAILKILDILKDGIGTLVSSILDSIFGAISGIIDNLLSGKLFQQIGESLYKGILGIFKSIFTMGGLFDWWGSGDSDKNLEKDIERLTNTNEALIRAVEELTDEMKDAAVADSGDIYQTQKNNLEQAMKNTQEMMSRAGANYSNGFLGIGGKHSSNKKINDKMNRDEWSRISTIVGHSVKSAGDFWKLTSEQMRKVANEAPDLYAKIKQYADDGKADAAQFMDEYIDYCKQIEELTKAYNEKLTDVSLDSVKDEFKSMLLDMESSTEDFAESFEKMMQQAVINSLMSSKYNKMISDWYDNFAAAMEGDDATITEAEQRKLKKEWDDIVESATQERDKLMKTMGWDGSQTQQSSSRSLAGMSQDTGDAIEGRLTALQIAVESIRTQEQTQTVSVAELNDGMLQLLQEYNKFGNRYDNIEKQIAKIYVEVQSINENTAAIVKPIQTMQEDIAQIKKNTSNI